MKCVKLQKASSFLVVFNCFQFQFSSNISIDLMRHSNFQVSQLFINVPGATSGAPAPHEHYGFPSPGTHLISHESWDPLDHIGVTSPTFSVCRLKCNIKRITCFSYVYADNFFQEHNVKHIYKGAFHRRSYDITGRGTVDDKRKWETQCTMFGRTSCWLHFTNVLVSLPIPSKRYKY